jgi:hypothetical protein
MRRKRRTSEEVRFRDELGRKQCTNCSEWKPEDGFSIRAVSSDGRQACCKTCQADQTLKGLYEEDPWLYACYSMLNGSGISQSEANARRLYTEVLPKDRHCPVFGFPMVPRAGTGLGKGNNGNKRQYNSPSLEHVIPKKSLDYPGDDAWWNLRIISWRANRLAGDSTPMELFRVGDWRFDTIRGMGLDPYAIRSEYDHAGVRRRDRWNSADENFSVEHEGVS